MSSDLNYRRARFIYNSARLAAEASGAPIVPELYDDREAAFRKQFEQVIEKQMGPERSSDAEHLHEDWVQAYKKMGWVYGPVRDKEKKTHPDMVPYAELGHLERDKDAVFIALCEIARKWVHDPDVDCDDQQELEKEVSALKVMLEKFVEGREGKLGPLPKNMTALGERGLIISFLKRKASDCRSHARDLLTDTMQSKPDADRWEEKSRVCEEIAEQISQEAHWG